VLVAAVGMLVAVSSAQAQQAIGAEAQKECPGVAATLGQTVTCTFAVENTGDLPAEVTALTETSPDPGGTPVDISCTAGGVVIDEGDTLAPHTPCLGTFQLTVPNDPTLCGTALRDRVDVALQYNQFTPPLTAGAFATHTTLIVCPAEISITKSADELSKVGDSVTYTFVLTNDGVAAVNRVSVNDTVLGDITASFPATLAAGASATVTLNRTVLASDPDPLVNTVTAIYSSGLTQDTATATDETNLFQPGVGVTKNCAPDPVDIGADVTCTIVVTNTSSADSPALENGTIVDTLTGNLLDAANTAIVSSTCTAGLATGGSCQIVTARTVLASDPSPLVNTVTVHYNPVGFPNDITANASDSVVINPPGGGEGCTPGFWKQDQHFDSWVGFAPTDTLESVFDVPDSLGLDDVTLLEALETGGGGVHALLRHAVAALLNASNPDVSFDLSVAEVIAQTNAALASGDFEAQKNIFEQLNQQGCPLS
jgi:uncharacterized repeat protein (TIGR01451 family)